MVNSGRYLVTPSSMAMLRSVIATARAIRVFGLGTLHQRHIVYSTDPVDEGIAFPSDDLFVTKGKGPVEIPRDQHTVLVIQPDTKQRENMAPMHKLEEAVSLVESISGWDVHETRIDNVRRPNNKHLFGTGKIATPRSSGSYRFQLVCTNAIFSLCFVSGCMQEQYWLGISKVLFLWSQKVITRKSDSFIYDWSQLSLM